MTHRIVMIDDSEDLRFLLRFSFESRGLAVVGEAGTAHEGVDLTATAQPDAVVADVNLPDESDLATIVARLRAAAPRAAVIALSAAPPSVVTRQEVVRVTSCDAYLDKGDGLGHLADQVANILEARICAERGRL